MKNGGLKIVGFCLVVYATYVLYMTKTEVDHNFFGVYQEDVPL